MTDHAILLVYRLLKVLELMHTFEILILVGVLKNYRHFGGHSCIT